MGHGQCFGSEFGLDPDSVGSLISVPILMTTERAGLEQQRRDETRRDSLENLRYGTTGFRGGQITPHKGTKVAIWDYRGLAEATMYQMSVSEIMRVLLPLRIGYSESGSCRIVFRPHLGPADLDPKPYCIYFHQMLSLTYRYHTSIHASKNIKNYGTYDDDETDTMNIN